MQNALCKINGIPIRWIKSFTRWFKLCIENFVSEVQEMKKADDRIKIKGKEKKRVHEC